MAVWEQQQSVLNRGCTAFDGELVSELTSIYNYGNGCYISDRKRIDEVYDTVTEAANNCDLDYITAIDNASQLALGLVAGVNRMRTFLYFDGLTIPRSSSITSATLTIWVEPVRLFASANKSFMIQAEDSAAPSFPSTFSTAMSKVLTTANSTLTWDIFNIYSGGTGSHDLSSYDSVVLNDLKGVSHTFVPVSLDLTTLMQYMVLQRRWKNPNTFQLCIEDLGSNLDNSFTLQFLGYSATLPQYAPKLRVVHDQFSVVLFETLEASDSIKHNHADILEEVSVYTGFLDNWPPDLEWVDAEDTFKAGFQRECLNNESVDAVDDIRAGFQTDHALNNVVVATDSWDATFYLEFDLAGTLEYVAFAGTLALSFALDGQLEYVTGESETSNDVYQVSTELEYVNISYTLGKAFHGELEKFTCSIILNDIVKTYNLDSELPKFDGELYLGLNLYDKLSYTNSAITLTCGLSLRLSAELKTLTFDSVINIPKLFNIVASLSKLTYNGTLLSTADIDLEIAASLALIVGSVTTSNKIADATAFRITCYVTRPTMSIVLYDDDGQYVIAATMKHIQAFVSFWNDSLDEEILQYEDRL